MMDRPGSKDPDTTRFRKVLRAGRNVALILFSVELVLQIASYAGRVVVAHSPSTSASLDEIVILCVGDSHTHGSPVAEEGYPVQLQAALDARFSGHKFRVVNLGLPGTNSAFVANRLQRQMLQLRPQVVIVWVGANNSWNVLETEAWGRSEVWTSVLRVALRSKLVRMSAVAWHGRTLKNAMAKRGTRQPDGRWSFIFGDEEVLPVGSEEKLPPEWAIRGLSFDHDRMVATVRALEVPILFINYPFSYGGVRRAISSSGERLGIPVIDSLVSLKRARVDGHSTGALIVRAAGPHPRGLLYGYIVEDLIPHIVNVMETWHGADLS